MHCERVTYRSLLHNSLYIKKFASSAHMSICC